MWTQSQAGRVYVRKLVQDVVEKVAPEEIDLFDELVQEYYAHPAPPKKGAPARDEALGFGLPETLAAVTPAATAMVIAVINHFLSGSSQAAQDEAAQAVGQTIGQKIRAWMDPAAQSGSPAANETSGADFSRDQLALVRDLACSEAKKFGVSGDEAAKLADALIGRLALL